MPSPRLPHGLKSRRQGKKAVNYKLRDWLFARQRYWGEPFPILWVDGEPRPIPEEQLPLLLPETHNFKPSGTGESPLANLTDVAQHNRSCERQTGSAGNEHHAPVGRIVLVLFAFYRSEE